MNSTEVQKLIEQNGELWFYETYLKIRDQDQPRFIPFAANNVQRDIVHPIFQRQEEKDGMVRAVILKARRMGLSTVVAGRIYKRTIFNRNTKSYIVAHEVAAAQTIFNMYMDFYRRSPAYLRPLRRRANARELLLDAPLRSDGEGLGSHIVVKAADDKKQKLDEGGIGRSDNIFHVHGSEVAFWGKSAKEIMMALQQSVPDVPGTTLVYESTGAEAGGAFFDVYDKAKNDPSFRYEAIFIPWFIYEKYRFPLDPGEKMLLDYDEEWLQQMHGVSLECLKWRRWTLANKCNGDIDVFRREYPSTDEEAFLYSRGKAVFNIPMLQHLLTIALRKTYTTYDVRRGIISRATGGALKVWAEPSYGRQYIVGVDPAEGLSEGCNQAIEVVDAATLEQVAEWTGVVPTTELGRACVAVAEMYNNATLAIEANSYGGAVINAIREIGYGNLYRMEQFGSSRSTRTNKIGWYTSGSSKPLIVQFMDSMIFEGQLILNGEDLIREAITYQYVNDDQGSIVTGPPTGRYSDRLMAFMIAAFIANRRFPRGAMDRKARNAVVQIGERGGMSPRDALRRHQAEESRRATEAARRKPTCSHGVAKLSYRR